MTDPKTDTAWVKPYVKYSELARIQPQAQLIKYGFIHKARIIIILRIVYLTRRYTLVACTNVYFIDPVYLAPYGASAWSSARVRSASKSLQSSQPVESRSRSSGTPAVTRSKAVESAALEAASWSARGRGWVVYPVGLGGSRPGCFEPCGAAGHAPRGCASGDRRCPGRMPRPKP